MDDAQLLPAVERGCKRALVELNRDRWSPLCGCFDRRHWGWKLVDYSEATLQRLLLPLVWWARRVPSAETRASLREAIRWALTYSARIQHRDGSFDQAFPYERSWGATAFLLFPLLEGFREVAEDLSSSDRSAVEAMCYRAATFVARRRETHGLIANHLAGGVQGLVAADELFGAGTFATDAEDLLERILASQSDEGWFGEYGGADPGYHSLCVYYLAWVAQRRPNSRLEGALRRATEFASWFVHPDGTYGGEYGSRRTALLYPGGFAMLAAENAVAARLVEVTMEAVVAGRCVGPDLVDAGNLAPLLINYCALVDAAAKPWVSGVILPCERETANANFPEAGLFVRSDKKRYVVVGGSNGGVLFVHEKPSGRLLVADGGYVGTRDRRPFITSQVTARAEVAEATDDTLRVRSPFVWLQEPSPTPGSFLLLRVINLSVGRSIFLGNLVKGLLVRFLLSGRGSASGTLERTVQLTEGVVRITDRVAGLPHGVWLLSNGRRFSAIHMASARYFLGPVTVGERTLQISGGSDRSFEWKA